MFPAPSGSYEATASVSVGNGLRAVPGTWQIGPVWLNGTTQCSGDDAFRPRRRLNFCRGIFLEKQGPVLQNGRRNVIMEQ